MGDEKQVVVRVANKDDLHYAQQISCEMATSAKARGTGIALRTPEYIQQKMLEGKAVVAISKNKQWAGFCYIEAWGHGKYVANSGLIVSNEYRGAGVATQIKEEIFALSRQKYPDAKIFGLTTGLAVMKINSELGYEPVTYTELTGDEAFWKGCQSCVNFEILRVKQYKNCICTAMLYDPAWKKRKKSTKWQRPFKGNFKLFERLTRLKKNVFMRILKSSGNNYENKKNGTSDEKESIDRI